MSQSFEYKTIWDAEKIMACICDVGHTGYDCSEWVCPNGDDPLTKNQVCTILAGRNINLCLFRLQVNEIQLVKCIATQGTFVLYYRYDLLWN